MATAKCALVTDTQRPWGWELQALPVGRWCAAGRQANTEDLGLEQIGVSFDERGVRIDRRCLTNIPSIWAVADAADAPYFSHWASHQARVVARRTLFPGSSTYDDTTLDDITLPWTTFTQPEVARIGLSEAEA
jgi:pyruvate/2-oxoglutarate dehydrogenase complex dihydrolipoamide dehydrogenase (E3) component